VRNLRNAISVYGTEAGSRKGTAPLSTMTRCRERSHGATGDCRCSTGVRTADCGRRSAVIVGSADWQQTDFLIPRSRCCDHNEWIALNTACSTIGYHSNSWAFCSAMWSKVIDFYYEKPLTLLSRCIILYFIILYIYVQKIIQEKSIHFLKPTG